MQKLDRVDVAIIDEFDAFIMNQPFEFKNNSPLHHYFKVIKGKSATMVVVNEELKIHMINLLGRMGRGMSI